MGGAAAKQGSSGRSNVTLEYKLWFQTCRIFESDVMVAKRRIMELHAANRKVVQYHKHVGKESWLCTIKSTLPETMVGLQMMGVAQLIHYIDNPLLQDAVPIRVEQKTEEWLKVLERLPEHDAMRGIVHGLLSQIQQLEKALSWDSSKKQRAYPRLLEESVVLVSEV